MASSAATWLHGQRKVELQSVAEKVGLQNYSDLKKADLEVALDEHMRANQSRLSKDSSLSAYYKRVNQAPTSNELATEGATETKTPKPSRRTTKAKNELQAEAAAVTRTPLALQDYVPLPPSPAVIATKVDRQAKKVRSSLSEAYNKSGVNDYTVTMREDSSLAASIRTANMLLELAALQHELLPFKYLTTIPASTTVGTPAFPVKIPDMFAMLTGKFWATLSVWFVTSMLVPLIMSYFFNYTVKVRLEQGRNARNLPPGREYDPITFNITKFALAFLVFSGNLTIFGWPASETRARIQGCVPFGYWQGVAFASLFSVFAAFWEAIEKLQKK